MTGRQSVGISVRHSKSGPVGNLLRRDGFDQLVSENFYRAVIRAVLLFWAENWVLLVTMSKNMKWVHVGFLQKVTDKRKDDSGTGLGRWRKWRVFSKNQGLRNWGRTLISEK